MKLVCAYGLLGLLTAGLSACATRPPLAPGRYEEYAGPGVVLLSSQELRLRPGQRFEYYRYSDDISSGRFGAGTYQLRGRRLQLSFDGQRLGLPSSAQTRPRPAAAQPDSLTLSFQVWGVGNTGLRAPLAGATVLSIDPASRALLGAPTDAAGRATLRLPRDARPRRLHITAISWLPLALPWPTRDTAYEVDLQPALGTPYAAGTALEFRVVRRTAAQLVLRRGHDTTTLVWRGAD